MKLYYNRSRSKPSSDGTSMYAYFHRAMLLALTVSLVSIPLAVTAEDWSPVVKRVMPSIVSLRAYNDNGQQIGVSSGFSVGNNQIVTCWHCVNSEAIDQVDAVTEDGKAYTITHVLNANPNNDLVLLRHDGNALPAMKLAQEEAGKGSPVAVIGSPKGFEFTVSDGIISSWRDGNEFIEGRQLQYTAPTSPGNSGGPVLNKVGEVLGVVAWGRVGADEQNLNFAAGYSLVQELIKSTTKNTTTIFSDRFAVYEKDADAVKDFANAFYQSIVPSYLYERELIRLHNIQLCEEHIKTLNVERKEAEDRLVRNEISKEIRTFTNLKREYIHRRKIDEPTIIPTGGEAGSVGELSTGHQDAVFVLMEILSNSDSVVEILTNRHERIPGSSPFLVHRISVENVVAGDNITIPGLFIHHGVERFETSDGNVIRLRAFSSIDKEKLHAAVRTMRPVAREAIEDRALRDFRRQQRN